MVVASAQPPYYILMLINGNSVILCLLVGYSFKNECLYLFVMCMLVVIPVIIEIFFYFRVLARGTLTLQGL